MYKINWKKELSGAIKIGGAKNAVLKIIPAGLLMKKVTLNNVPDIEDIQTFIQILTGYWVECSYDRKNKIFKMDSTNLWNKWKIDNKHFSDIRASIMLLSPILKRLWEIYIPTPGWDKIWRRGIEAHVNWLNAIWYKISVETVDWKEFIKWEWKAKEWNFIVNWAFSVTWTENIIISNILRKGETTIKNAAIEPHVMNLIDFFRKAWADIKIRFDNTIVINWVEELDEEIEFDIISDYLQSGTYMVIAALCSKEYLDIQNARIQDLYTFLEKFKEMWVKFEDLWNDTLRVYRSNNLKAVKIQTNIHPWFPTDLQSLFALLMTQAKWESRIHEILYEWRLWWLVELEKMWANLKIVNPHEAKIFGESKYEWKYVDSWDLRAGCAVAIAGLMAEWQTVVTNVQYIKRGYEDFVGNLKMLWADIEEIEG